MVNEPFTQNERLLDILGDVVAGGRRRLWRRGDRLHGRACSVNLSCDPTDLRFNKIDVAKLPHRVLLACASFVPCLHTSMTELGLHTRIEVKFTSAAEGEGQAYSACAV